ncbi:MAG: hypothetical protein RLY66_432 [Candidatus Parcubacteria bacterium]|jgi:tetratricopeptide (TPR) repeat protein
MFCENCGTKSDSLNKFCTNCGKELLGVKTSLSQKQSIPNFRKTKFKASRNIGRVFKLLFIVAIVGWIVYASMDDAVIEKNNSAVSNYDSGNSQQALNQLQQASHDAVSNENKVNTLKNLAYVYSGEGQNDLAISTFKEALIIALSDSFDYYLIAGEIAMLESKPNAALLAFNKAYSKDPNDFQINNSLALFYMDLEDNAPQYVDYPKALKYAQRAVQLTDLQIAKQNLGMAYYFNENYPQAISIFSSITLDADTYIAYWLGLSYARNDDPINAQIYLRKAIANGVEVPQEVYDYLAEN